MPHPRGAVRIVRMLRSKTVLAGLAALTTVLVPATADAAKATFALKLEAKRTVEWDQPRVLLGGSCSGQNFSQGRGSETFELTSRKGGRLVVEGTAKRLDTLTFGTAKGRAIVSEPPTAKGMITRDRFWLTGRTGGWCGGAETDPVDKGDCGTRLPPFTYHVSRYGANLEIRETRGTQTHEDFHFRRCQLITPNGVPADSLPTLGQKIPIAKLFNRRETTIPIEARKEYGPDVTPLPGGAKRTTKADYEWTLTLTRIKNLKPRSENG
jgi:hypothetical protein